MVPTKDFCRLCASVALNRIQYRGIESDNSKFDYQSSKGGHAVWLAKVNAIKLSRLTPEKIREWHSAFLARAGGDPMRLKQLRVSANSFIRSGKALFSPKLLKRIELEGLPASPFADFEIADAKVTQAPGARFIARFTKCRGAATEPLSYDWTIKPEGDGKVPVMYAESSSDDIIVGWVRDDMTIATEIAKEMGVTPGAISKRAARLIQAGRPKKNGRGYALGPLEQSDWHGTRDWST